MNLLAIVVLYQRSPRESPSLLTLLTSAAEAGSTGIRLKIIVADNTPGGQTVTELPTGVAYRAYPHNPGLAEPYNDGLAAAEAEGYDWLLTLDQDTHLPPDFLQVMAQTAQVQEREKIAAVVPHIRDHGRPISPFRFVGNALPVVLPAAASGIAPRHVSALNSASLLSVPLLRRTGGYDTQFALHNSDTSLYQRLDRAGFRVAIADVTVEHELSILRREARIRPERYRVMLRDECRFWDAHMSSVARLERIVRLMVRYVKGLLTGEDVAFRRVTADELRYRLATRRRHRLETLHLLHDA